MIRTLLLLFGLFAATAAKADWRMAETPNFIAYSPGDEQQLREWVEKLERLHFVMRGVQNVTRPPHPVKLRVFLMRNVDAVARTFPYPIAGVNGYYEHSVRGPMIVGTRMQGGSTEGLVPEVVLQHEYAHHFMFSYSPATYPTWYTEGFAEFWSTVELEDGNVVEIGHPAVARLYSFAGERWMPLRRILAARSYADARGDLDLVYAEGWLLNRYLFDNRARRGQLQAYLDAVNAGKSYEEATDLAFGEGARELNEELRRFAFSPRFPALRISHPPFQVPEISIRELRPAEEALVMHEIRLGQGLLQRDAAEFVREVRGVVQRYPDDPYALAMLAEGERLAGQHEAALATANRLLAVAPDHGRGLALKGLLEAEALRSAGSQDEAAWDSARAPILRAHRLAPGDPLILEAYYDSFTMQGLLPPVGAQNALFRALALAPGDGSLRHKVASDFEQRDMIEDAIQIIRPLALASRHNEEESERERQRREREAERWRQAGQPRRETAREMLTRLEARLAERGSTAEAATE